MIVLLTGSPGVNLKNRVSDFLYVLPLNDEGISVISSDAFSISYRSERSSDILQIPFWFLFLFLRVSGVQRGCNVFRSSQGVAYLV